MGNHILVHLYWLGDHRGGHGPRLGFLQKIWLGS